MDLMISDSFDEVQEYLDGADEVVVDIETTSLTVGKGRILCIGFGRMETEDVLVWWPKDLRELRRLRIRKMIAHNAPFENKWLCSYGTRLRIWWDTMFMAHLIDENHPIGLKDLVVRLLGYEDWADDNVAGYAEEFGRFEKDQAAIPRKQYLASKKRVSIYNGKDVHYTRELVKWQRRHLRRNLKPGENPRQVMSKIMIPAIEPLTQMEHNRMPVRMNMVMKTQRRVEAKIAAIEQKLEAAAPPKEEWPDWIKTINWGNTNWTKWWLFVYQGALCPARTKPSKHWPEGTPSLAAENLAKIDHPAARLLVERSTLYKQLTGFLNPIMERTRDGRIPTSFKLTGTVTGRLSSSSPTEVKKKADATDPWKNPGLNSQQIPRDRATRTLFGERGLAWIEADFSQLELRVIARLAEEQTMLSLFEAGEDIHTYMAHRLIKGREMRKEDRSLAKGVNFGFVYGMQAKHFANYVYENYGVIINPKDSEVFREEYFTNFSGLEPWYRKQRKEAIEHGGVHNEFGRFRHLPKVYHEDFWIQENAFRQAINSPVQSLGSDFMLISLGRIARDYRLQDLGAKLITTVHDSVCLTAPYKTARKVGRIVKETMEQADDTLDRNFLLKADVTISRCWGGEALAEF
ncbi:DNA polymerase I [Microbacterium phage Luna18]|nr:DNA polymerase I [Microbacterium phage Chepli]QZE10328.1 DNA polymerase I [Microbacterium phage KatChan]URQ04891.1 DNA polymerase I [Microbacterium phage Luna18]